MLLPVLQKLLLISIVFAAIGIPVWAAQERNVKKAFKKVLFYLFAFNVLYVISLRFLFYRLF
jgi:hypothetical protein